MSRASVKCLLCKQVTGPDHHSGCDRFNNPMCAWHNPLKHVSIKRDRMQVRCDMILNVMRLRELMTDHLHPDELAGYHYVIPVEKLDAILDQMTRLTNESVGEMSKSTLQHAVMFEMQQIMNESNNKPNEQ